MASVPANLSSEDFDKLIREYTICDEQAARLESHIWQTATVFGVGSAIGLVTLASQAVNTPQYTITTIIAAIFATNVSLVWWRFARRWWSIQHLKFERMAEIDDRIGFQQSALINRRNTEVMAHIRFLQKRGSVFQRLANLYYSIPKDLQPTPLTSQFNYEYRGIQPAARLLLLTNVALWITFGAYVSWNNNLLPLALASFGLAATIDLLVLRLR